MSGPRTPSRRFDSVAQAGGSAKLLVSAALTHTRRGPTVKDTPKVVPERQHEMDLKVTSRRACTGTPVSALEFHSLSILVSMLRFCDSESAE